MKAFLWHNIEEVSDREHCDGSVLIEAERIERAREIALYKSSWSSRCNEMKPIKGIEREPDLILISKSDKEKVWIFPNEGCC